MLVCSNCGTQNTEGTKFCRECGTPLGSPAASAPPPRTATPSTRPIDTFYNFIRDVLTRVGVAPSSLPATTPPAKDIRESLLRLGISFSRGQLIGFGLSLLGGMIVARILPFIYPVFDPILTLAFGSGASATRDGFNTNMMTLITFFTSFALSFVTMALTKAKQQ